MQVSVVTTEMSSDDDVKDSIFSCDNVTFRLDAMEQKVLFFFPLEHCTLNLMHLLSG